MCRFKIKVLAFLLVIIPTSLLASSLFNYDSLGYKTALTKKTYITTSVGYSYFYNPEQTSSINQIPIMLMLTGGQRFRVTDRLFSGYELLVAHLASQSFRYEGYDYSDHAFEFGLLGTLNLFFNPYLEAHIKMGMGYQKHTESEFSLSGFDGIFGSGLGLYINANTELNLDVMYFSGKNDLSSPQNFTTFTLGIQYFF